MDWREKYKDKIVTPEEAVKCIKSGDKVVVGQINGISELLIEAMCARANELENISIYSSLGYKKEPYLNEKYRGVFTHMASYCYPTSRKSYKTGMTQYTPMFFHEYPRFFREVVKPEVAFIMLSEPDEDGNCSFSMNADFIYEAAVICKNAIFHINPAMPRTRGTTIPLEKATFIIDAREEPLELPLARSGAIEEAIARHIVKHIDDESTLQLGIGGLPDFILSLLTDKKDLGIHTEVLSDAIVDLHNKGVITNTKKKIDVGKSVATCMIGTNKLSDFVHDNDDILILPVDYTNDPFIISQNDKVVSINSALEIDLLGQVNADTLNGYPYSGVGGHTDFVRGAKLSKGGQSFIAMPSTAAKGKLSRIVCNLGTGSPVTTSRFDVNGIVTEFGVAKLWGRTIKERAKALIDIAHPDFREQLEKDALEAGMLT